VDLDLFRIKANLAFEAQRAKNALPRQLERISAITIRANWAQPSVLLLHS